MKSFASIGFADQRFDLRGGGAINLHMYRSLGLLPESKLVESWGGKAVAIPFEFARSTTNLVEKIRQR